MTLEKFKRVWDPIDRVVFGLIKYICVALLAALVAIVFYIFIGRYIMHDSPMWGRAAFPFPAHMDEYSRIFHLCPFR